MTVRPEEEKFDVYILRKENVKQWVAIARSGGEKARVCLWAAQKWLEDLPTEYSACSCCDTPLSPEEPPPAFLVLIPVISDPETISARAGGICPDCSKHDNKWLLEKSLRRGNEVISPPLTGPDVQVG
jgi:hypothetical protein